MKVQLDGTIWDLSTQANMALIWMTRKGSWVQVPHGPQVFCLGISGTGEPSDGSPRDGLVVDRGIERQPTEQFAVVGDHPNVEVTD